MSDKLLITETEAKELLRKYVSNDCYAIESIHINRIEIKNVFVYRIESFIEKRKSVWKRVPYFGGVIDDYGQCL